MPIKTIKALAYALLIWTAGFVWGVIGEKDEKLA
jgi:hypothetical protein